MIVLAAKVLTWTCFLRCWKKWTTTFYVNVSKSQPNHFGHTDKAYLRKIGKRHRSHWRPDCKCWKRSIDLRAKQDCSNMWHLQLLTLRDTCHSAEICLEVFRAAGARQPPTQFCDERGCRDLRSLCAPRLTMFLEKKTLRICCYLHSSSRMKLVQERWTLVAWASSCLVSLPEWDPEPVWTPVSCWSCSHCSQTFLQNLTWKSLQLGKSAYHSQSASKIFLNTDKDKPCKIMKSIRFWVLDSTTQ